jgi:HEAT repeat protein
MSLARFSRVGLVALTAWLLSTWSTAEAICPSKVKGPGGQLPPGMREPFDPPPASPEDPSDPEPPADPADPAGPTTPPPTSGPVTPPPSTTPDSPGSPTTPRARPPRGLDALDDTAWELWYGLNRADILPRVQRQSDVPDGNYARALPAELRGAVDLLIAGMSDKEPSIRQMSVSVFVSFSTGYRSRDTLEALRRCAKPEFDLYTRDLAHLALAARGDTEAAEGMRDVLRSKGEMAVSRGFAALGLIKLNDAEGRAHVLEAIDDLDEPEVAGAALIALGHSGDTIHLPVIMKAAKRSAGSAVRLRRVRGDAIIAMGKLGDPKAIPFLAGELADKQKAISRSAALALGGFKGDADAAKALRDVGLKHEDAFVRAFSAVSLGRLSDVGSMPALARLLETEQEIGVVPFANLAVGLLREKSAATVLDLALAEDPRTGKYATAALACGLLDVDDRGARIKPALEDVRNTSAPACSAVGLALMGDRSVVPDLKKRFWFDSARVRPGFDVALSQLDAEEHGKWLASEIKRTKRNSTRGVYVDALSMCGGPSEGAALAELYGTLDGSSNSLKVGIIMSLAAILNDRTVTYSRGLMHHTYYLQPNIVLNHVAYIP